MRVFVAGATGFIGAALVRELLGAGHDVVGLARSAASAKALAAAGARAHRGALDDLDSLRRGAAVADGVIHLAYFHAITHLRAATRLRVLFGGRPGGIVSRFTEAAVGATRRAIGALGDAPGGADRPLVAALGTLALTPSRFATEDDAYDPRAIGGPRGASEQAMLALAAGGVRAAVVRLLPVVHGVGDRAGFAPRLIQVARKTRASAYVGDGRNRWPAVHRLDAARLFRLALDQGSAGATYHGRGRRRPVSIDRRGHRRARAGTGRQQDARAGDCRLGLVGRFGRGRQPDVQRADPGTAGMESDAARADLRPGPAGLPRRLNEGRTRKPRSRAGVGREPRQFYISRGASL